MAFPNAGQTTTSLNFTYFLSGGTYTEPTESNWFTDNETLVIAVASGGGGLIIILILIVVLIRWNRKRQLNPNML